MSRIFCKRLSIVIIDKNSGYLKKITARFGTDLSGLLFGIWGLAFKPNTDDLREAPALELLSALMNAGASVRAYDPIAMDKAQDMLPQSWFATEQLLLVEHQYDALKGADAMVLVTEWKPFRHPDFEAMKRLLRKAIIFDGRNLYDPAQLRDDGFEYTGIGR